MPFSAIDGCNSMHATLTMQHTDWKMLCRWG